MERRKETNMVSIPAGVGWTSLLTAYGRAQEALEIHPRFIDACAAEFVEAAVEARVVNDESLPRLDPARDGGSSTLLETWRFYFTQRTPFYDRHILREVAQRRRQVVILGAGLDSRAFRLGLPAEATVFEVDQAAVLEFKHDVLKKNNRVPTCHRKTLTADVTAGFSEPLRAEGFDPTMPVIWVLEGLLMYLTEDAANRLMAEMARSSASGSVILSEYFVRPWKNPDVRYDSLDAETQEAWDLLMKAFLYGPVHHRPGEWLTSHGWIPTEVTTITAEAGKEGRAIPDDWGRPGANDVWLFSGVKGAE
ncbi:SAM-dependent methyltransferase [Streptomyces sp. NPDC005722]